VGKRRLDSIFNFCAPETPSPTRSIRRLLLLWSVGELRTWNVKGGGSSFGPNVAVEITPIENWLELEVGVTRFSPVTPRNGTSTFCSRNLGRSQEKWSSCWASVRLVFLRRNTTRLRTPSAVQSCRISCSGLLLSIDSVGTSSPVMSTTLGMSSRSE
jgi:hypothetical protein